MKTVEISDEAFSFLKANAEPLVDTVETTLDRLLAELRLRRENSDGADKEAAAQALKFGPKNLPNVTHTKFLAAYVNGSPVKKRDWNHLLAAAMAAAANSGCSKAEVLSCAPVNIVESTDYAYSYYAVPGLGVSFQGVDAKRACSFIAAIASQCGVKIKAKIQWYPKEGAAYPGEQAELEF